MRVAGPALTPWQSSAAPCPTSFLTNWPWDSWVLVGPKDDSGPSNLGTLFECFSNLGTTQSRTLLDHHQLWLGIIWGSPFLRPTCVYWLLCKQWYCCVDIYIDKLVGYGRWLWLDPPIHGSITGIRIDWDKWIIKFNAGTGDWVFFRMVSSLGKPVLNTQKGSKWLCSRILRRLVFLHRKW